MTKALRMAPQLRVALYAVLAAGLAVAVVAGWVTQEQSTNLLEQVDKVLGLLASAAFVLAASNVKTAAPAVDAPAIANEVAVRINTGLTDVATSAQSAVNDVRRQVEQELGHRLGR
ncbi:hypothetical protein ACTHQY_08880 [Rhodococcoides corynebacterioides]|uniref:hypothetical protein n=1 Tax=Rhodococcoides corynebacterioides TaxID=53972 RepID=UPI003F805C9F